MYDIVIRGGTVFDGSEETPRPADVAISDGHVVAVLQTDSGSAPADAAAFIDATGKYVTPGFIDPHSHSDFSLMIEPDGDSKLRQGVTTEMIGNCGESPAPAYGLWADEVEHTRFAGTGVPVTWRTFGEYTAQLASLTPILNVMPLVGHGAVRACVMGIEDRAPTADELNRMKDLTRAAMSEGAWGLSSGLIYPPGVYSRTDELIELARVVREFDGLYASHIRGEGRTVFAAIKEAYQIGQTAGVPVQVSHLKVSGYRTWHRIDELMDVVDAAARVDVPVYFDQYPYAASSTSLLSALPEWTYVGGSEAAAARLADPDVRRRLRDEMEHNPVEFWDYAGTEDWSGVMITSYPEKREYQGKTVAEVAAIENKDPLDALLDVLVDSRAVAGCVLFDQLESNVKRIMQHERVMTGSDGYSLRASGFRGQRPTHPRSYGTFPRVLGQYTRQEKVLDWVRAVHKMTGLPARALGLCDRGSLKPGAWADVVVFDPGRVTDRATFTDAHQYPAGIDFVLVNGQVAVAAGETTGLRAGKVLSHSC